MGRWDFINILNTIEEKRGQGGDDIRLDALEELIRDLMFNTSNASTIEDAVETIATY